MLEDRVQRFGSAQISAFAIPHTGFCPPASARHGGTVVGSVRVFSRGQRLIQVAAPMGGCACQIHRPADAAAPKVQIAPVASMCCRRATEAGQGDSSRRQMRASRDCGYRRRRLLSVGSFAPPRFTTSSPWLLPGRHTGRGRHVHLADPSGFLFCFGVRFRFRDSCWIRCERRPEPRVGCPERLPRTDGIAGRDLRSRSPPIACRWVP